MVSVVEPLITGGTLAPIFHLNSMPCNNFRKLEGKKSRVFYLSSIAGHSGYGFFKLFLNEQIHVFKSRTHFERVTMSRKQTESHKGVPLLMKWQKKRHKGKVHNQSDSLYHCLRLTSFSYMFVNTHP